MPAKVFTCIDVRLLISSRLRTSPAVTQGSAIALNVLVINLEKLLELPFVLVATVLQLVLGNGTGWSIQSVPLNGQTAPA